VVLSESIESRDVLFSTLTQVLEAFWWMQPAKLKKEILDSQCCQNIIEMFTHLNCIPGPITLKRNPGDLLSQLKYIHGCKLKIQID